MREVVPQLVLVGVLILVNAAFAGTELALVSLREGQLQRLERASRTGEVLAALARDPNRFLATIQIGITLAGFLASAAAAVSLAEPLQDPLSFLGGAAEPASIVLVTLLLAYLTLVFGELAPKRVAMQRAERWGMLAARPLAIVERLTRPGVWLLSRSTDLVVRIVGGDPRQGREQVTVQELRELVSQQTVFTAKQRLIIDGAFEISERKLEEVMRHRRDVYVVDADEAAATALPALAASGHSRAPVAPKGTLDDVVGLVHLRDLLDLGERPTAEAATPMRAFPESADVLDVLHEMQRTRCQMILVVDEHGAASGIVTVEDLVEELVGEIYDETDRDILAVRRGADGSLILPGQFPVHDLPDAGIANAPQGPYTTLAGLMLHLLGHLPDGPGEVVTVPGWRLEVRAVRRRAIVEVLAVPIPAGDETGPLPGEVG